jgi:hypothetical protein
MTINNLLNRVNMRQLLTKSSHLSAYFLMLLCVMLSAQASLTIASEVPLGELSKSDFELAGVNQCFNSNSHPNGVDLCALDKLLTFIHPNIYFSVDKTAYSQRMKKLQEIVPELTTQEFYLHIAEFVANLNDAHTYVDFSKVEHTSSPISLRLKNNKVQLDNVGLSKLPKDSLTLLAVNDHNAADLVELYSKYFPYSNKQPDKQRAARNLLTLYSLIQPNKEINLQVKSNSGNIFQVKLTRLSMKVEAKEQLLSSENIQCQVDSYLVLKIKQFDKIESFFCAEKIQQVIKSKKDLDQYSLIIDLRDNYGGDADVAKELSYMIFGIDVFETEEKVRLVTNLSNVREPLATSMLTMAVEKSHISQQQLDKVSHELDTMPIEQKVEAELSLILGSYNNIKFIKRPNVATAPGYLLVKPALKPELITKPLNLPIYILTNNNTSSAAALFALYAQKHLAAKLIGTGIGGDSKTFGSSLKITLPHSKLPIYIASAYLITNNVEHYKDIQWPSYKDTPIKLDQYLDSEPNETPLEIIKSLFSQPLSADKSNATHQGVK